MGVNSESTRDLIQTTVGIVCAYVANNPLRASDLPALLGDVHSVVSALANGISEGPSSENGSAKTTAAQIRQSITPNALISFVDGKPYKMLKRHLGRHGLDVHSYRARYGLPNDYPTVAPNYSAARSSLAKTFGLGRPGARAETVPEQAAKSVGERGALRKPARL